MCEETPEIAQQWEFTDGFDRTEWCQLGISPPHPYSISGPEINERMFQISVINVLGRSLCGSAEQCGVLFPFQQIPAVTSSLREGKE